MACSVSEDRSTGGRLFKSVASSALAFSAIVGGVMLSQPAAQAGGNLGGGAPFTVMFNDPIMPLPTKDTARLVQGFTDSSLSGTNYDIELTNLLYPNPQTQIDTDFNYGPMSGNYTGPAVSAIYSYVKDTPGVFDGYFITLNGTPAMMGTQPSILKEISFDSSFSTIYSSYEQVGVGSSPFQVFSSPIPSGTMFYVRDTFRPNDGAIDNGLNQFRQTPGPLPILGAGAAFGFSRNLRGRIKASRSD